MFKLTPLQKSQILSEVEFKYVRSSGPGGQNVNKVSSAAQLRWNVELSSALMPMHQEKLLKKLSLTNENELLVTADVHRDQKMNREECIRKLFAIIEKALFVPKARKATKPTYSSQKRRVDAKKKRGEIKSMRRKNFD